MTDFTAFPPAPAVPSAPQAAPEAAPETDCRPQVALPERIVPTWVLGVVALALGGVVLLALNGQRSGADAQARTADPAGYAAGSAIPALPPALDGGLAGVLASPDDPSALSGEERTGLAVARYRPAFSAPVAGLAPRAAPQPAFAVRGPDRPPSSEANLAGSGFASQPMPGAPMPGGARGFAASGSSVVYDGGGSGPAAAGEERPGADSTAARARIIRNRPALVAQGEIVSATLETPVNSDRPGLIRAVVSRDVRSFDGSRVLIPRGSRLIGDFRAEQQAGRRRILATWTRLIRPDGVAIRLDSPAADVNGGIGIPGQVNSHFLARFANAALQTAMVIGVNLATQRAGNSVIVSSTGQLPGLVGQNIVPGADAQPTVAVKAGAPITVFVARDLDFSGVPLLP